MGFSSGWKKDLIDSFYCKHVTKEISISSEFQPKSNRKALPIANQPQRILFSMWLKAFPSGIRLELRF